MILRQDSLFQTADASPPAIAGLRYLPEFVDAASEESLIQTIDTQPWIMELKRRVQHYGYKYDYRARGITQDLHIGAIPNWLVELCDDLQAQGCFTQTPDQVIINEYQPGQGISSHIDCVPCFGGTIASLSLGSPCVMDFLHQQSGRKSSLLLETRSLLVFSGEARYEWLHRIAQRKADRHDGQTINRTRRLSLTFRTVIIN